MTTATDDWAADGATPTALWRRELPYLAMLALALGGIAYTNLSPRPTADYWQLLAPIYGAICVAGQWRRAKGQRGRWRLVWTQALHWGALLLAMRLMFLPDVQRMMNSDAIGLGILALLALGTFLAGVHAAAWQIGAVGVILALAVPAIAFLQQAVLLTVLILAGVVGLVAVYLWQRRRDTTAQG